MFYLLENRDHWYKKFNMYPKEKACPRCGVSLMLDLPFLSKNYMGLCSSIKCCDRSRPIYEFRPRSAHDQAKLNEAFEVKKQEL